MERYSEGFGFILTFGLLTLLSLNLVPQLYGEKLDVKRQWKSLGKVSQF